MPVLDNDDDADGGLDPSSVAIVAQPAQGTAVPQPDGSVVYTPAPGTSGQDGFSYTVADFEGLASAPAAEDGRFRVPPALGEAP